MKTKKNFAETFSAAQLVSHSIENYAKASGETFAGNELLLKVAEQYEKCGPEKTQGRLFEIIEMTKFNTRAAEQGAAIRAVTTELLGDPHATADILIRKGEEILKEVQAKSSNSAATAARKIADSKYGSMDRLVNVDKIDRVKEIVDQRAHSRSIYSEEYKQAGEHVTGKLTYQDLSSKGTSYDEALKSAKHPENYILDTNQTVFAKELFHAARDGAIAGAIIGGGMAAISEVSLLLKGETSFGKSLKKISKKAGTTAGTSAIVASLGKGVAFIGRDTILMKGNVAAAVASSAVKMMYLTYQWVKGELTTEQYILQTGETGASSLSGIFAGLAAGAMFGPVGATVGGIVGLLAGQQAFQALTVIQNDLSLSVEERKKAEKLSEALIAAIRQQGNELRQALTHEIEGLHVLNAALLELTSFQETDKEKVDMSATILTIASTLNITFQYRTQAEFDEFMLSEDLLDI